MQEFSTTNYYEILGLETSVDTAGIRRAYRQLSMIWHPDKWSAEKHYPPYSSTRTKEEAESRFRSIDEAYKVLIDSGTRASYDEERLKPMFHQSSPIAVAARRKADDKSHAIPTTEESFLACIKEDAAKHAHSMFQKIQAEPLKIQRHFWQLIAANKLSYADLETAEVDRSFLWDVIYRDEIMVNHVAINIRGFFGNFTLSGTAQDFIDPHPEVWGWYIWLERAWQYCAQSQRRLSERERFMLNLLSKDARLPGVRVKPGIGCDLDLDHSIMLHPFNESQGGLCSPDSQLMKHGGAWVVNSLRDYMSNPQQIPFERFWQRMVYGNQAILGQSLTAKINNEFYKPLQVKLAVLDKIKDAEKIKRLTDVLTEIEQTLIDEFGLWIEANERDAEAWAIEMAKTVGGPHAMLYDKIKAIATKAARRESKIEQAQAAELRQSQQQQAAAASPAKPPRLSFFRRHPVVSSSAGVALTASLGIGVCALTEYLKGEDPWNWLTTKTGMGTPTDLAIILAAVIVVLLIAAGCLATRIANRRPEKQPPSLEGVAPSTAV